MEHLKCDNVKRVITLTSDYIKGLSLYLNSIPDKLWLGGSISHFYIKLSIATHPVNPKIMRFVTAGDLFKSTK